MRLFDCVAEGGLTRAAETFADFDPDDNAIVFFPADRHHEITRMRPSGNQPVRRYAISGLILGDPKPVEARTRTAEVLPTLATPGFEVRPTPEPVQRLLEALLELRRGDPDVIDVIDFADDLLRWLQPVHEDFAGALLRPSGAGRHAPYRPGESLILPVTRPMHVISSVLAVAQDLDVPWPLVVEHRGVTHEIFLDPGQMLVYESAVTRQGRLTSLQGRSSVNLFAHYRPLELPTKADLTSG